MSYKTNLQKWLFSENYDKLRSKVNKIILPCLIVIAFVASLVFYYLAAWIPFKAYLGTFFNKYFWIGLIYFCIWGFLMWVGLRLCLKYLPPLFALMKREHNIAGTPDNKEPARK